MNIPDSVPTFRKTPPRSNPYRMLLWLGLIIGGILLTRGVAQGEVKPLFLPTPTPTRTSQSYAMEGETHFNAGDLEKAIVAYKEATRLDPQNADLWAELARIQGYSSNQMTTDDQRRTRLQEALASADKAEAADPFNSTVRAVRAFVLDWYATPSLAGDQWQAKLTEAEQEAVHALQLDNQNTLALAYYSEILVDQQKWIQAEQYIQQAVQRDPSIMDVHRVYAYVLETLGEYNTAIEEYQKAVAITPNLTFLYIRMGANYRRLKVYDKALLLFIKAANLNSTLGVKDPIPYLSIAKTATQMGDFRYAAQNVRRALNIDPSNSDVYAQLGIVYFQSRNYEGAIPAFECALRGCSPAASCEVRNGSVCDASEITGDAIKPMPLTDNTAVYYYTYGSVLSGLHRKGDDKCTKAMQVFTEIRQKYESDTGIMSIVKQGEAICSP